MIWPDRLLGPGEIIVGRWTSRGIAFGLGLFGLYGLIAIVVFGAAEVRFGGDEAGSGFRLFVALLAPLPVIVGIIASVDTRGRPPMVALTDLRLLWRPGVIHRRTRELPRTAVAAVTAYEADGRVRIETREGKAIPIAGLADAPGFAAALGVPGRIWRSPPDGNADEWHRRFVAIAAGITNGAVSVVTLALLLFVFHAEWGVWPLPPWLALPIVVVCGTMLAAITTLLVTGIVSHVLARRRLQGDALHAFACRQLCRLCQGRAPYPEAGGTLWDRFERPLDRWIVHRFYGGQLDCDCQPVELGPGTDKEPQA